ncbi:unnamed protein product [Adineta ricciae]|uniref:Uncharacterized protein n=1 Tax=Adineta ricciae TaxID=249248 RepID=A0A814QNQ6_ADIRI|nr:unnamed protein product [Adineta ricciae]CAF1387839.1 unnamed protein product [Adineta ricciae]
MQAVYADPKLIRYQRWRQVWPTPIVAIIATAQLILTFLIVGFEAWSMVLNVQYSFFFIGDITSFFFTITWISTFTVVCCNRGSQGCAIHALVENILSIIASCILLGYDAKFINQPDTCLWSAYACRDGIWTGTLGTLWSSFGTDTMKAKLVALKLQLACAVLMLFVSLLFVAIYIYTSLKVRKETVMIQPQTTIQLVSPPPISLQTTTLPPI